MTPTTTTAPTEPQHPENGTLFAFGEQNFEWGREIFELQDSSELMHAGDFAALHSALEADGYLFLRGFHPRELANVAEQHVLEVIRERGGLNADGTISEKNESYGFFRDVAVAHAEPILRLVNGEHTFAFYEQFFGGEISTFDKKWLRAMAQGGNNGFHYDSVYVGRGTPNRVTMWSAISDIPFPHGPLVVALGSHRDEKLKATYGASDLDRDLVDPVFSSDPREIVDTFGFPLATAHFQPGDVLIFPMLSMHSSAPNLSNQYRVSIDTRYQLASEPIDERFYGEDGKWIGNFHNKDAVYTPMSELKERWGLKTKPNS